MNHIALYSLHSVVQLADGRLCSGSSDKTIKLFDQRSGECEMTLRGHTGFVQWVMQVNRPPCLSGYYISTPLTSPCSGAVGGRATLQLQR